MKVLVVHWGQSGGGPRFAFNIANGLAKVPRCDVWVSYCDHSEIISAWESSFSTNRRFPTSTYKTPIGVILRLLRLARIALRLRRLVRHQGMDVVYSPMFHLWFALVGRFIAGRSALLLESVHDAVQHPGDESQVVSNLDRRSRDQADALVTYSRDVYVRLIEQGVPATRLIALRHGVESVGAKPRSLRSLDKNDDYVAAFLGRIRAYKGLDLFVDAIKKARANNVPIRGVVYGEGDVPKELIDQSIGYIDWNIGWVPEEDFGRLTETADIVILPYLEASQSGVLAQAATYGTPAIVTPVGGLAEQTQELGIGVVCENVSAESVATEIEKLLASPSSYNKFSRRGLVSSSGTNNWAAIASDLIAEASRLKVT